MNKSSILIDNWTLEEVRLITEKGLPNQRITLHSLSGRPNRVAPMAAIQIDSLFNLLIDIVLREELIVNKAWEHVWKNRNKQIDYLNFLGIIKSKPFISTPEFLQNKDLILRKLNLPAEIFQIVKEGNKYKDDEHRELDLIVSGVSDYLSHSALMSISYSPHPRRNYFLETTALSGRKNAIDIHLEFIRNEKLNILQRITDDDNFIVGKLTLAPLIIEMIESADSIPNMFKVAMQMRSHYKNFREHLNQFQQALDQGDFKQIEKTKRMLDEVSKGNSDVEIKGGTKLAIGLGLISFNLQHTFNILGFIKNRFGIRSTLKKLIFTKANNQTFEKFFDFFDEKNIVLQEEIIRYFQMKNKGA